MATVFRNFNIWGPAAGYERFPTAVGHMSHPACGPNRTLVAGYTASPHSLSLVQSDHNTVDDSLNRTLAGASNTIGVTSLFCAKPSADQHADILWLGFAVAACNSCAQHAYTMLSFTELINCNQCRAAVFKGHTKVAQVVQTKVAQLVA